MGADQLPRRLTRAFTLRELLVTVSVLALLALIVAPGPLQLQRREAQLVTCADRLGRISQAVAACFAENNGYGPTFDDGDQAGFMLTWTDLLYDMGYLPRLGYQLCPADERPDFVAEEHGSAWHFYFVDHFGVNEPIRHGVRTSYALNFQMATNFAEDKFEDASRQVYAIDGWWSWFACLNAAWVLYEQVTGEPPPSPLYYPIDLGTMVGWRHGAELSANVLYVDGHVAPLTPIVPDDAEGLLTDTVDTMLSFTWLPGERDIRPLGAPYQGELEEYWGLRPYWTDPEEGTYKRVQNLLVPIGFPEELSCSWRTFNSAWLKLPNDPRDRR
jgi:prepilin-type processing-associated H-X9-DG protein/prepilin-type N-terminal cleavage/methylation domain-containing protein